MHEGTSHRGISAVINLTARKPDQKPSTSLTEPCSRCYRPNSKSSDQARPVVFWENPVSSGCCFHLGTLISEKARALIAREYNTQSCAVVSSRAAL